VKGRIKTENSGSPPDKEETLSRIALRGRQKASTCGLTKSLNGPGAGDYREEQMAVAYAAIEKAKGSFIECRK